MAYRFDRSGEIPSRISFALGLTALAIVLLAPLLPEDGPRDVPEGERDRVTLVEREGTGPGVAAVGLCFGTALPFLLRNTGLFKTSQRVAATGLVLGALVSITTVGLFFVPSAALMVLAATRKAPADPFR